MAGMGGKFQVVMIVWIIAINALHGVAKHGLYHIAQELINIIHRMDILEEPLWVKLAQNLAICAKEMSVMEGQFQMVIIDMP